MWFRRARGRKAGDRTAQSGAEETILRHSSLAIAGLVRELLRNEPFLDMGGEPLEQVKIQPNRSSRYSGFRSRASSWRSPSAGVSTPFKTAWTPLEIGRSISP